MLPRLNFFSSSPVFSLAAVDAAALTRNVVETGWASVIHTIDRAAQHNLDLNDSTLDGEVCMEELAVRCAVDIRV